MLLLNALIGTAGAQFGLGLPQPVTAFTDPNGRFTLEVPDGWSFQADLSESDFFVFFGPGEHDVFLLEVLQSTATSPTALAAEAIEHYRGPGGLTGFTLLTPPSSGVLGEAEASFIVYAFTGDDGTPLTEGRAFTVYGDVAYTLAFGDASDRFQASVPTFNNVMASLKFTQPQTEAASGSSATFGMVNTAPSTGGSASATPTASLIGQSAPVVQTAPSSHLGGSTLYTSPGGFYRFSVPGGWALWEEQSTARGDTIDQWNGVFGWQGRPTTKSLFVWDYFDEWEQTGAQYEIVMAVVENVPGALNDALTALKDQVMGGHGGIYTVETTRLRIGAQAAVAASIVVRPGMVEPWTIVSDWYKSVTFYGFKQGLNFFFWVIPNEITEHPDVVAAMQSFEWLAR